MESRGKISQKWGFACSVSNLTIETQFCGPAESMTLRIGMVRKLLGFMSRPTKADTEKHEYFQGAARRIESCRLPLLGDCRGRIRGDGLVSRHSPNPTFQYQRQQ